RAEARYALSERQVRRPEIVAPLRDAVCLVDGDEAGRVLLEERAELVARERLGRGQDEERSAIRQSGERLAALGDTDRAVQSDRRNTVLHQLLVLVLEQRQERRHDDRRAIDEEGGQLIAERFPTARRQDEQRILAAEHAEDRPLLLAMQARDTEALPREAAHLVDHPMRVHGLGFETFEHSVTSDGVCTPAPETPCMSGYF